MCKRSVLVRIKPGLFTVLLVVTLLAIAKPGACRLRFLYLNKNTDCRQIAEDIATESGNKRGISAILAEGRNRVAQLQQLIPESIPAVVAGGIFADLDETKLNQLRKLEPALAESDAEASLTQLEPLRGQFFSEPEIKPQWNFVMSGAAAMKKFYQSYGEGRTLAVISLDFPYNHISLQGKVKQYKLFGQPAAKEMRSFKDLYLTHPLGMIVGNDETLFEGIAPKCEVILAQISQKAVKTVTLLEALEWIITLENPPDAILFCTDFNTVAPIAVQRALFACRNAGIIPIVPAGNNPNSISGMAALPCCVTVAAIDRWQQRALFSGTGPVIFQGQKIMKPDCVEPGSAVLGPTDQIEYKFGSGTLQAAAHFAGIFLQIKQVVPPETDPEQIISAMLSKTTDIGDAGPDYETGFGLPQPLAAVTHILYPPEEENAK